VVGEGVVRVRSSRQERVYDRENYIDFRMRLLGEPGTTTRVRRIFVTHLCRSRPFGALSRDPQFSLQAGTPSGPPFDLLRQTRMGAVFLQNSSERAKRTDSQKPTSVHCDEPDRSKFRTVDLRCKSTNSLLISR
jgi:hypothetical protein